MKADPVETTRLLKTARGQIDGILRMIEQDQYCIKISHQLLACEAILRKANRIILREHMVECVREATTSGSQQELEQKVKELTELIDQLSS
jgi:Uncharacterized protein conserved in bacteria